MRSIKNCPCCKEHKPLCQRQFGTPLMALTQRSKDNQFIVSLEIDVCTNCNNVYATRWQTIRTDDPEAKIIPIKNESLVKDLIAPSYA